MTPEAVKTMCKAIALLAFGIGGLGCVACLPYAMGYDIRWVSATGIYFVAGGIMIVGGLFTYAYLATQK